MWFTAAFAKDMAIDKQVLGLVKGITEKYAKDAPNSVESLDIQQNKLSDKDMQQLKQWVAKTKQNLPTMSNPALQNQRLTNETGGVNLEALLARGSPVLAQNYQSLDAYGLFIVFVSLSMPKASLVDIVQAVHKAGGKVIIRGMIDNNMQKTIRRTRDIIATAKVGEINIDPRPFDMFGVQSVPTFIMTTQSINNCLDVKCTTKPVYDKLVGNVSVEIALENFVSNGDTKKFAAAYLQKLRGHRR